MAKKPGSLLRMSQFLEREVYVPTQLIGSRCVSVGKDASAIFKKQRVVRLDPHRRFQHFASLVPVDLVEAGIDGLYGVTSVTQVVVKETTFLEPDRRIARVR